MRLLHAGHGDGHRVHAQGEPEPHRGTGEAGPGRHPGPVHRLPQHRQGRAGRRGRRKGVGVIPSSFTYTGAGCASEALDLAAEYGEDAKFLAGGHSLLPLMKLRLAAPEVIIDLGGVRDLSYVTDQGSYVAIGALTRHHDVEHSELLGRQVPLLAYPAALATRGGAPRPAAVAEPPLAGGAPPADAAARAAEGTSAADDIRATRAYREHLARVLVSRALTEASSRS